MSRCSSFLAHTRSVRLISSPSILTPARQLPRYFSASSLSSSSSTDPIPSENDGFKFPNLMQPDVLFDSAHTKLYRGRRSRKVAKISVLNDPSYMAVDKELNDMLREGRDAEKDEDKNAERMVDDRKNSVLHRYPIIRRGVALQTGKGKRKRMYQLIVVGNGDGLVGYGEGKNEDMGMAASKSFIEAVRNMDAVERFEQRTIWTDMSIKLASTRVQIRPRPVGFGLHCNPNIHQVLKAAGIKDASAKVWGSRNPINVVKATCMLIQSGNAPLSMGNGIGGKGKRLDVGIGMRSKEAIERDRGRKLLDGRTW
ncbi:hypothetical protein DFH11DRAFT_1597934 [Phellopilus nigrolimitatus]|nr:hypothetical protein DFH11DRAFT_1597934 [Phellopilus nigrolimitatus]